MGGRGGESTDWVFLSPTVDSVYTYTNLESEDFEQNKKNGPFHIASPLMVQSLPIPTVITSVHTIQNQKPGRYLVHFPEEKSTHGKTYTSTLEVFFS